MKTRFPSVPETVVLQIRSQCQLCIFLIILLLQIKCHFVTKMGVN